MYTEAKYLIVGDRAVTIELGNEISPEINSKVRAMTLCLEGSGLNISCNPTYRSLTVEYDPLDYSVEEFIEKLREMEKGLSKVQLPPPAVFQIPVLYGGMWGQDLDFVASHSKLSVNDVIEIHSSQEYLIYMLGFSPGFPYLGGMDKAIAAPRLESPRTKIPAGSVGIAGEQTGVYSVESPGGWRLIGRTPIRLYDPSRNPPVFYKAGDYIKFVPIDENTFKAIKEEGGQWAR